jgi:hypothetical protein
MMAEAFDPEVGAPADKTYEEKIKHRAVKRAEGVAALSVLTGMGLCAAALEAIRKSEDHLVQSALFSGFVVNYARAFEEVNDPETQTVRRFSTKKLPPPFSRSLHDTLLSLRNEQIAHADHVLNDYALTFMTATLTVETPQADGTVITRKERHLVGTRARASLACGPSTAAGHDELLAHVRALENEAGQRLAVAIVEHDAASIFRLEQQAKEGTNYAKTLKKRRFVSGPGMLVVGEEDLALSLAKTPEALPLGFAVMHYHVVEKDGVVTLKGLMVTE